MHLWSQLTAVNRGYFLARVSIFSDLARGIPVLTVHSLEGMEEIFDPPLDMFRLYVPDLAAFSTSKSVSPLPTANNTKPRPVTNQESLSYARERLSIQEARTRTSGIT